MGRRSELSRTSAETDFPSAATAGSRLLRALGREPKDEVDAFAELAAAICWTPHGYVTILDGNRLYFKGSYGDRLVCVPRPGTFCDHALHHDAIFIVPDTAKDPRFFPLRGVGARLGVRFYAGVPLRSPSSEIMGVLCVLDTIPRELKAWQVRALTLLGEQVSGHLADRLKETEQGVRVPDRRHNTRREADAHFHAFFDLNPGISWILDAKGHAVDVSARWEELTGMSRSLAHNFGWTRALHPQDLQSTMTSLQEAVYKGLPISLEYRAIGADGTWHYMRSQGKPQRNMADETLFWYGTAVEISELKALEQQVLTCKAEIRRLRGEGAEQVIAERSTTGLLHRMRTPYDPLHRRTDRS